MSDITAIDSQTARAAQSAPSAMTPADMERWFDQRFEQIMRQREEAKTPSMAIIATKGTLDWAYPPFILATTGAALGWDVSIFFTFYGLLLLKKDLNLEVSPLGNPAMPMKMPVGPDWFQKLDIPVPNAIAGNMPGFEQMATSLMKKTFANKGVASIEVLREACIEEGVQLNACQMTVDVFGFDQGDFIPEVTQYCGAASFLPTAQASDVTLFM